MGTLRRATKRNSPFPIPRGPEPLRLPAGPVPYAALARPLSVRLPSGTSRTHTQHQSGAAACVAANALKTRARRPGSTAGAGRKRRRVTAWTETSGGPHAPHARAMVPIDWPLDAGGSPEPPGAVESLAGKGIRAVGASIGGDDGTCAVAVDRTRTAHAERSGPHTRERSSRR